MIRSVKAALVFGLTGAFVAMLVLASAEGGGWMQLTGSAGLAAFLVSLGLWYLVIKKWSFVNGKRGALIGLIVGIASHPVTWYIHILYLNIIDSRSSLNEPPIGPIDGLYGSLAFTFWSLLLFGWLTAPIAALLGAGIGWFQNRKSVTP